jgi:hypothetical protein
VAGNRERSFGLSVGSVVTLIAVVQWWRGHLLRAEFAGALGVALILFGAFVPSLLAGPSAVWWRFSKVMGHINARVILTTFFVLVLTPVGLAWRMAGYDPLARRRGRWPGWRTYPSRHRDRHHYSRMF